MAAVQGLSYDPAMQQRQGAVQPQAPQNKPWEFNWLQPQGAELRQKANEFGGINAEEVNKATALAGQQQREQNVGAYNAAIASQRGMNPAGVNAAIGQNLANVNAGTSAQTQGLQAQNTFGAAQANQQQAMDYYKTLTAAGGQQAGIQAQKDMQKRAQFMQLIQSLLGGASQVGGAAALGALSDERAKQPVDHLHETMDRHFGNNDAGQQSQMKLEGSGQAEKFVSSLHPQSYEYKSDSAGNDGGQEHLGVMAQDLEKTPAGRSAVHDSPEGKIVDTRQLSLMLAAGLGHLHERLERLEGGHHGRSDV